SIVILPGQTCDGGGAVPIGPPHSVACESRPKGIPYTKPEKDCAGYPGRPARGRESPPPRPRGRPDLAGPLRPPPKRAARIRRAVPALARGGYHSFGLASMPTARAWTQARQ